MYSIESHQGWTERERMRLTDCQSDFLRYMEYRKRSTDTTIDTYQRILKQFATFIGNKYTNEITIQDVNRYADHLSLQHIAPKTFRNKLCIVRSLFSYMYRNDLTDIRPEKIELPPNEQAEMSYLTLCEAEELIGAARKNPRDYAMLSLFVCSGLRVSELAHLKTTDIFKRSISVKNGKGRKHRVTFMSKDTEQRLNTYMRKIRGYHDGYVFPNPDGDSLSRAIIARKVKHYSGKAGIQKPVTVHTLRHTFATNYLDQGGRIEDLQQMLGHADLKTTCLYLHFSNERLHRSYDKIVK